MTLATGIGSYPGDDERAFDETVKVVLGELPGLPHLPELPARGPHATMTGRALAVVTELSADLQPEGWRLTASPGVDQRRSRSLLAQDLDGMEEQGQQLTGPFKIQVAGPWTLAATVERPRGDRLLADHGARWELAQALAEGLREHIADVQRRLPGTQLLVQIDEPALPLVLAGKVPTASGFHRHRSVDAQGAAPALETVFGAIASAGATPVVHCCAAEVPFDLLTRTGAHGVFADLDRLGPAGLDGVAEVLESGRWLGLGVVPTSRPAEAPDARRVTQRVERLLDMLGLEPTDRLVVTPACGLAGADLQWARAALGLCRDAARNLSG